MSIIDKMGVAAPSSEGGRVSAYADRVTWYGTRQYRAVAKAKLSSACPSVTRTLLALFLTADGDGTVNYDRARKAAGCGVGEMCQHMRSIEGLKLVVKTIVGGGPVWRLAGRLHMIGGKSGAAPIADGLPRRNR